MDFLPGQRPISRQIDRLALYALSLGAQRSFEEERDEDRPALEEIIAQTRIKRQKSNLYNLTAPGEHKVWLDTPCGEIQCHIRVRLAIRPSAPLLIFHHGLAESPYTLTWYRILPKFEPFPAHLVAVQAPFHSGLIEPITTGLSSVQHIYQMFAGSLRLIELVQELFEASGAAYTVVSGYSLGGIASLLYEALFAKARASVPLFASPDLAAVMAHVVKLTGQPLPVERDVLDKYFDFTPSYQSCDVARIFPVLGKNDQFFQFDEHAAIFSEERLKVVPDAHVGAFILRDKLRRHLLDVLVWAAAHPR